MWSFPFIVKFNWLPYCIIRNAFCLIHSFRFDQAASLRLNVGTLGCWLCCCRFSSFKSDLRLCVRPQRAAAATAREEWGQGCCANAAMTVCTKGPLLSVLSLLGTPTPLLSCHDHPYRVSLFRCVIAKTTNNKNNNSAMSKMPSIMKGNLKLFLLAFWSVGVYNSFEWI